MKKLFYLLVATTGFLVLAGYSQAQIITWGTVSPMTGDIDVSTAGSYVDAATFGATGETVNTVQFNTLPGGTDGAHISVAGYGTVGYGDSVFSSASPSSAAYSDTVSTIGYTFSTGTVTLSGLTSGDSYQLELWSYDSHSSDQGLVATSYTGPVGTTPLTLTDAQTDAGSFVIGTFTASGVGNTAKEQFEFNETEEFGIINAVSVRDVTSAPEPSVALLMGVGLLALVVFTRRKPSNWREWRSGI